VGEIEREHVGYHMEHVGKTQMRRSVCVFGCFATLVCVEERASV